MTFGELDIALPDEEDDGGQPTAVDPPACPLCLPWRGAEALCGRHRAAAVVHAGTGTFGRAERVLAPGEPIPRKGVWITEPALVLSTGDVFVAREGEFRVLGPSEERFAAAAESLVSGAILEATFLAAHRHDVRPAEALSLLAAVLSRQLRAMSSATPRSGRSEEPG